MMVAHAVRETECEMQFVSKAAYKRAAGRADAYNRKVQTLKFQCESTRSDSLQSAAATVRRRMAKLKNM